MGDKVFIWRTLGKKKKEDGGIIAEAVVTSYPELREDDKDERPFYRPDRVAKANELALRVYMNIVRIADRKEIISRKWFLEDPILSSLPNIRMPQATNYIVSEDMLPRLGALWANTGRNFNRSESLACLHTYSETLGGTISKTAGSPVSNTALLIGRAVQGVYNKLMNFRHIDQTDRRIGLSGGSEADRQVWDEFFDSVSQKLRKAELDSEFKRIWGSSTSPGAPGPTIEAPEEALNFAVKKLQAYDLAALLKRYADQKPLDSSKPHYLSNCCTLL